MQRSPYLTWLEIDLDAIAHNARVVQELAGPDVKVMAVVKTEAYGFGGVQVAKAAVKAGIPWLAVVRGHEALDLRRAGVNAPVLVMGGAVPAEVDAMITQNISLPLYDFESVPLLSARAKALGYPARVHLKIETGLARYGVFPDQAVELARAAASAGGILLEGVFTQLAQADVHTAPTTDLQHNRFMTAVDALRSNGFPVPLAHISSSASLVAFPKTNLDMVRIGSGILGVGNEEGGLLYANRLKQGYTWKAQLMSCKRYPAGWKVGYGQDYETSEGEIIGVLPVGHADGFYRHPDNVVLIEGKRAPVVGKVCLDQMMISLPHMMPLGTEAVLIGKQGEENIAIEEAAARWGTPLSMTSTIHSRIPRVYLPEPL